MKIKNFESIRQSLVAKGVVFEEVTFTDVARSARTSDTSVDHNYDPTHGIKTLIIKTKTGMQAIILRGSDNIDQAKLKSLIGKWSIVKSDDLISQLHFQPGTVCPLDLNIPILVDQSTLDLPKWSMGAGNNQKGFNVLVKEVLKHLPNHQVVDVAIVASNNHQSASQINPELLTRRVTSILPSKKGLEKIMAGKKIRLYQGFDPTFSDLHLGHTVGFRKLMDFARAGHEVIFLFGTGTVLAGDPSKREKGRGDKLITQKEIDTNIKTWKKQVGKIVDFDLVKIKQNGDWLTELKLKDILNIASNISATQLFKRESFTRRIKAGDPVWYHETMYPLLQGYDSVVMDVDLEIGGTDQEFNMLIGRELQKKMAGRDKYVLTTPMINGTDGKKMSKSIGNCIFLTENAESIYRKIMAMSDNMITTYYELLTDIPLEEIKVLDPTKPLENKKRLAFDITRQLHDTTSATKAATYYDSIIRTKSVDPNQPTIHSGPTIFETLKNANLGVSNSEIKRVIEQGGVEIDGKKITDLNTQPIGKEIKFGKSIRRKLT